MTITFSPDSLRSARLWLCALLSAALLAGAPVATGQSLMQEPVTKEQLEEAAKEAEEAANPTTAAGSAANQDSSTLWLMIGASVLVMGGVAVYMLRDASFAAGGGERAAVRKPVDSSGVRGAPKALFTGDAEPGGKVGKRTKREKAKRQRQARRTNRKR